MPGKINKNRTLSRYSTWSPPLFLLPCCCPSNDYKLYFRLLNNVCVCLGLSQVHRSNIKIKQVLCSNQKSSMNYDMFILYARDDASFAKSVAKALEKINISVLYKESLPRPALGHEGFLKLAIEKGMFISISVVT